MNFNKLDKIQITQKELLELFKWKDENKDLVRAYRPILLKGLIEISSNDTIRQQIAFEHDKDTNHVRYKYYGLKTKMVDFKYNREEMVVYNEWFLDGNDIIKTDEERHEAMADILTIHSTLMAFVENFESEVVIKDDLTKGDSKAKGNKKSNKKSNKKNNKKKSSKVSLIRRKVFIIPKDVRGLIASNPIKRDYTRQVDEWSRKGHWRYYRDSKGNVTKRVWIDQTVCKSNKKTKDKTEKLGKTYTLGIDKTQGR